MPNTPVLLIEWDAWPPASPEEPALLRVLYDDLCNKPPPPVTSVYSVIVLHGVSDSDLRGLPRAALDWLYKSTTYSTLVLIGETGESQPLRQMMGLDAHLRPDPTAPVF